MSEYILKCDNVMLWMCLCALDQTAVVLVLVSLAAYLKVKVDVTYVSVLES